MEPGWHALATDCPRNPLTEALADGLTIHAALDVDDIVPRICSSIRT